jgi:hypothetical protein
MTINSIEIIKTIIQILGFSISGIGLFLAYRTLKANHDWNRRNFAAQAIEKWSSQSLIHRKAIEKTYPGLYDHQENDDLKVLSVEEAEKIYKCTFNDECWEIRFHILELLNYFEYISVAYNNKVADQVMIEKSFKNALIKWHRLLSHFIEVVEKYRKNNPWKPYSDLVNKWKAEGIVDREKTDRIINLYN